jgi:hypothetical protein
MKSIVTWTLILIMSWLGWWVGSYFGLVPGLFLSLIGSGVGMFSGGWLARNYG